MNSENIVSVIALVVSLVAILIATSQLLAQIFATAEGTCKCSRAVIGHWSTLTTRKWHWSEWRFETIFLSPEIRLGIPRASYPYKTLHPFFGRDYANGEEILKVNDLVLDQYFQSFSPNSRLQLLDGWLAMLTTLRSMASSILNAESAPQVSWPCISLNPRF